MSPRPLNTPHHRWIEAEWSIDSIASHSSSTPVMSTQLALHALTISEAVHALGSSLLRRYPTTFPDAKT